MLEGRRQGLKRLAVQGLPHLRYFPRSKGTFFSLVLKSPKTDSAPFRGHYGDSAPAECVDGCTYRQCAVFQAMKRQLRTRRRAQTCRFYEGERVFGPPLSLLPLVAYFRHLN